MAPLYLGSTAISKVYKGTTELAQNYVGDNTMLSTVPSDGHKAVIYAGNSSNQSLNFGFKPGIFWSKSRSVSGRNYLTYNIDSGRYVFPSSTQPEEGVGATISYTSTGIDLGNSFGWNWSGATRYSGWAWGMPDSGTSNSDGSITTTTYANTAAGQSMFTYTGNSTNATIGHGLDSTPEFVVIKTRGHTSDWPVYHSGLSNGSYRILFNSDIAQNTSNNPWNSTVPNSTTISLKSDAGNVNQSGRTFWGWAMHSVAGYSKFGTYTGAGSSQGITGLGFQPDMVWIKNRDATDHWAAFDSAAGANKLIYISSHAAEESFTFSFDSDGFTVPSTSGMTNGSGVTYLYCAWKFS